MIENKKVISRSLIFLFLSLSLVYSLTYMKKTEIFRNVAKISNETPNKTWTWDDNKWNTWSDQKDLINLSDSYTSPTSTSNDSEDLYPTNWIDKPNTQNKNTYESTNSVSLTSNNVKLLPGTTEYFGTLDIVSILWEKPKYTLQDSKGNYFAYYGDHLNFIETVETLGWNVYEMVTESEIIQNQLFGDRVSYINLSMFKNVWVIMVIRIDEDIRLLQVPYNKYHYSKDYLKSLFIN